MLTATTVMRLFELSQPPPSAALEELAAAGVLSSRRLGRARACLASAVFELIIFAELRPASTRWGGRRGTVAARPLRGGLTVAVSN